MSTIRVSGPVLIGGCGRTGDPGARLFGAECVVASSGAACLLGRPKPWGDCLIGLSVLTCIRYERCWLLRPRVRLRMWQDETVPTVLCAGTVGVDEPVPAAGMVALGLSGRPLRRPCCGC